MKQIIITPQSSIKIIIASIITGIVAITMDKFPIEHWNLTGFIFILLVYIATLQTIQSIITEEET